MISSTTNDQGQKRQKKTNGKTTVYWYVNRKRRQKTLSTPRMAEDWLAKKRLEREKGVVYDIENKQPIMDIISLYLKNVEKSANSIARDVLILKRLQSWLSSSGIRYVSQLNKREVADYERLRKKDDVCQRTVNIDIKLLNAALNYAWKIDEIQYNPIAKYPYKREDSTFERFLSMDEIDAILTQARLEGLYDAVYAILTMGLRCEEACFLQHSDLKDHQIHLRKKNVWYMHESKRGQRSWAPKWGRERWVSLDTDYINDKYLQEFFAGKRSSSYCFPHRSYDDGRPYTRDFLYNVFKRTVERAGIKNHDEIKVHTLRHTHISYMVARVGLDKNINFRNIMDNVGIGDLKTLMRYTKAVKNLGKNLPDPTRFPWQQ